MGSCKQFGISQPGRSELLFFFFGRNYRHYKLPTNNPFSPSKNSPLTTEKALPRDWIIDEFELLPVIRDSMTSMPGYQLCWRWCHQIGIVTGHQRHVTSVTRKTPTLEWGQVGWLGALDILFLNPTKIGTPKNSGSARVEKNSGMNSWKMTGL